MSKSKYNYKIPEDYLLELSEISTFQQKIPSEKYTRYNVKRGLRNENGTGVLVGLTSIGEVSGYLIQDNEIIPAEGHLSYRGVDINDIAEDIEKNPRHGFEEVAYLLLFGQLPDEKKLQNFKEVISNLIFLPEGFTEDMILKTPSKNIMIKLARSILALYSVDENPDDTSIINLLRQSINLVAKFPIMAAYAYQAKCHYFDNKSLYIHPPIQSYSIAENFLHLIRPDNQFTKLEADILDLLLITHAEHGGGNNSTFTSHVVASSGTDIYSAVAAAIGSLKGPKHGGANIKVSEMFNEIKENVHDWSNEKQLRDYLEKILRKQAFDRSGLIYGMGHAVYTLSDPRAVMIKKKARKLAEEKGALSEFELLDTIERISPSMMHEIKGIDKTICANIDLYSGFVYQLLNIPTELYTPLFAIARLVGWCAHILEENISGGRIMRPAYKSVSKKKEYVPLSER